MTALLSTESVGTHRYTWMTSPVGRLLLTGDESGLATITIETQAGPIHPDKGMGQDDGLFRDAVEQLQAYFVGELKQFDLQLKPQGTPFQQRAWAELQRIPYGQTISYGEQARRMGDVKASRAVGRANGANPIAIIVPCHRVIGGDGSLTGFGAGLAVKEWLLNHEAGLFPPLCAVPR